MTGPFDRDFDQRRKWWDERLWLQMIFIGLIVVLASVIVYGVSVHVIIIAGMCTLLIYGLTRVLMR